MSPPGTSGYIRSRARLHPQVLPWGVYLTCAPPRINEAILNNLQLYDKEIRLYLYLRIYNIINSFICGDMLEF